MPKYADLKKAAKANKEVEPIGIEFVPMDKKGVVILGKYLSKAPVAGRKEGQFYNQYLFETDAGVVKFQTGGVFDGEVGSLLIPGEVYEITFKGQEKIASGRRVNHFTVDHIITDREQTVGGADDLPDDDKGD